jgi:FkbM family methyltransferase
LTHLCHEASSREGLTEHPRLQSVFSTAAMGLANVWGPQLTLSFMQKSELSMGLGRGARLISESGALTSPFTLVDIGARDGIHLRWESVTAVLEVYGYDASAQVASSNPRRRYIKAAIGERDGEACIELCNGYEAKISSTGSIVVAMHKLDTLYARGELPKADFIKIDCEGYEPEILRGAEAYLTASGPLGVDVETTFNISPTLPESHFVELFKRLNRHDLFVADFAFESATGISKLSWPGTCNALFARKFAKQPSADMILKMIAVCDVYALYTRAQALIVEYSDLIDSRIDINKLRLAVSPSKPAALIYELSHSLPHLGLGVWSTARRLIK